MMGAFKVDQRAGNNQRCVEISIQSTERFPFYNNYNHPQTLH